MAKKLVYISIILGAIVFAFIPLITENHIYRGVALGGDTARTFIPMMNMATSGVSIIEISKISPYLGSTLTMWVVGVVNRILRINPEVLFYLYSIVILFGSGITLYYLGKLINGVRGGWVLLVMGMLCNTSILALFTWGCTINILNVYIIFIWAMMLLARWYQCHKWYWLVLGLILLLEFSLLHPTGSYLPFTALILAIGISVWYLYTKRKFNWWIIGVPITILIIGIFLTWGNIGMLGLWNRNVLDGDYLLKFIRLMLTPIPILIGIFVLWSYIKNRKEVKFSLLAKYILAVLASLFVVLVGASMLQATILPERQILDASAVMAIIIAIVLGALLKKQETQLLKLSSYALMSLQSLITLRAWIL